MVFGKNITVETSGFSDIRDITGSVGEVVHKSGIKNGIVHVFAVGSTASVTTIEYEPALVEDMKGQLEKFASSTMQSRHSETWGDDNGFSHIRATFMGRGMTMTDLRVMSSTKTFSNFNCLIFIVYLFHMNLCFSFIFLCSFKYF